MIEESAGGADAAQGGGDLPQLQLSLRPGSGILLAALIAGLFMRYSIVDLVRIYFRTIWRVRYSLLTIVLMLALGYLTRYSGLDATLGLAFALTGLLYPMFGTLLGWLG